MKKHTPTLDRKKYGVLQDERGKESFARHALSVVLAFTLYLIWKDSTDPLVKVQIQAYALLGTAISLLCVWAGGRAMMRYVGPQIGRIAEGLGGGDRYVPDDELPLRVRPDPE